MLVLARKRGERIRIKSPLGEVCWIEVVEIQGYKTRLGLTFPTDYIIAREELIPISESKERANGDTSKREAG